MSNTYNKEKVTQNPYENHLHTRVEQHENKLVKIETILERVASNQDRLADSIATISASIVKQELLLEKLGNLEENTKMSINRLHKRVDDEAKTRDEKLSYVEKALNELDLARTFSKYPKLAIAVFMILYLFSIKEFRDILSVGGN